MTLDASHVLYPEFELLSGRCCRTPSFRHNRSFGSKAVKLQLKGHDCVIVSYVIDVGAFVMQLYLYCPKQTYLKFKVNMMIYIYIHAFISSQH